MCQLNYFQKLAFSFCVLLPKITTGVDFAIFIPNSNRIFINENFSTRLDIADCELIKAKEYLYCIIISSSTINVVIFKSLANINCFRKCTFFSLLISIRKSNILFAILSLTYFQRSKTIIKLLLLFFNIIFSRYLDKRIQMNEQILLCSWNAKSSENLIITINALRNQIWLKSKEWTVNSIRY